MSSQSPTSQKPMSLVRPLKEGWDWMVRMLFRPFDLGKWIVVGFAAWLAGLAGGGKNYGANWSEENGGADFVQEAQHGWEWLLSHGIAAGLIAVGLAIVLTLIILVLWLSSRGKFIFLDNVVNNRSGIVEPWRRLRRLGNSLFAFRLLVLMVCLPLAVALTGACLWIAFSTGGFDVEGPALVAGVVVMALFGLSLLVATLYAVFFLDAFVVPLMYRFDLGVLAAWKRFFRHFLDRPVWFLGCGILVYGLMVAAFSVIIAAGFMTCCLGFILLALPYVGTVLLLPLIVAYRAFTVAFLAQMEPELRLTS